MSAGSNGKGGGAGGGNAARAAPTVGAGADGRGPWSGVRVLDLTGLLGAYGTRVWAALGADVICVEPTEGNPIRRMPPLAPGHQGPEASLWWAYFGATKRSVVLDPTHPDGAAALVGLIGTADVVLDDALPHIQESYPWLADSGQGGLGIAGIVKRFPRLTWVSITPFGMTGPRRHWQSSNLVGWASCGLASTVGFPHGPPLAPAGEIGVLMHAASLHAVIGSMLSLRARDQAVAASEAASTQNSGPSVGQTIDLSLQEVGLWLSPETGVPLYLDDQVPRPRAGNRRPVTSPMGLYPASDGHVAIIAIQPTHWNAVAQWVHEVTGNEGILDDIFVDIVVRREALEAVDAWVEELTTRFTKQELFIEGQRRRIPITPVNTVGDLRHDPHLDAVGWWRTEEHPVLGSFTVPGSPFTTDGDWWAWKRAPLLGEHTDEVLNELV
ncbi:CaiB/BaiF CoA transferase family protein [Candidatus Poriferisodalis sp.]|uniref:CaiB/BaiF CoA transferase family protein n=1 Tax=Candidatus Poriferisodalis sp. TaxID=3101277 RepID=UPI003B029A7C